MVKVCKIVSIPPSLSRRRGFLFSAISGFDQVVLCFFTGVKACFGGVSWNRVWPTLCISYLHYTSKQVIQMFIIWKMGLLETFGLISCRDTPWGVIWVEDIREGIRTSNKMTAVLTCKSKGELFNESDISKAGCPNITVIAG